MRMFGPICDFRTMRPALNCLLILFYINCALSWNHEYFKAHLDLHYVNATYFPPIPSVPLHALPTAWTDHIHFAVWLVQAVAPDVILDLGVDYGYSTFCFALPGLGQVYGIDTFGRQDPTGHTYDADNYDTMIRFKTRHSFDSVHVIVSDFASAALTWARPVDIIHIDGTHTLEAVTNDWNAWVPKLRKHGVLLFHDILCFQDVVLFFRAIKTPKVFFTKSCGLGIVSNSTGLLRAILSAFSDVHYGEEFFPYFDQSNGAKARALNLLDMADDM